jgi:hypothetical protein
MIRASACMDNRIPFRAYVIKMSNKSLAMTRTALQNTGGGERKLAKEEC